MSTTMRLKLAQNDQFDPAKPGFGIRAANKTADIWIYDVIGDGLFGGVGAKQFADDLKALGRLDTINVFINSPGGDVFQGLAIYNVLKRNAARVAVQIDGLAASIASVIAMAGEEIVIAGNGMMMIHDPWTCTCGNASEMREIAETLDKIGVQLRDTYVGRTQNSPDDIAEWMAAETWMTADEAVEKGFADSRSEELKIAACAFDLSRFRNAPKPCESPAQPVAAPATDDDRSITERIIDHKNRLRHERGNRKDTA